MTILRTWDQPEGHWYTTDGQPMYTVPRADGQGFRATTVADARKLNLLPSVSGIHSVLYKPGLAAWKEQQVVMASLTLPKREGESLDEFAWRAVQDSKEAGRAAADAGTRIHTIVEWWLQHQVEDRGLSHETLMDLTSSEQNALVGFDHWARGVNLNPEILEHAFSHFASEELGYGGRVDCIGSIMGVRCVIDWKTQDTTEIKKGKRVSRQVNIYPEWGTQLAAYAYGIGEPDLPGLSVVISRDEPGRIETYFWSEAWRWPAFEAMKYIYHSPLGQGHSLGRR